MGNEPQANELDELEFHDQSWVRLVVTVWVGLDAVDTRVLREYLPRWYGLLFNTKNKGIVISQIGIMKKHRRIIPKLLQPKTGLQITPYIRMLFLEACLDN